MSSEELDGHSLARLTKVPASEALGPEASAFTPWLAEHIAELGDEIGVHLTLGEGDLAAQLARNTEVDVGGYSLDIRAETGDGRVVAIENQYGGSDHKHLGQLITYASGVGADVVIWIGERFNDAHLEAIRWLNQRTDEDCCYFAIRIEFIKIGDSSAAPRFDVLSSPSDWAKTQRRSVQAAQHWTKEEFLAAIASPEQRRKVEDLFNRSLATSSEGLWYGRKPRGQINFHPNGAKEGPFALLVNSAGEVNIFGLWTNWARTQNHPAYSEIAELLGQSSDEGAKMRPFAGIDHDELWKRAIDCVEALRIEGQD